MNERITFIDPVGRFYLSSFISDIFILIRVIDKRNDELIMFMRQIEIRVNSCIILKSNSEIQKNYFNR